MNSNLPTSHDQFYQHVLGSAISSLKLNTYLDNFDARRFNHDGKDRSKEWVVEDRVFYFDWFFKNSQHLFDAYSLLDNDQSKNLYVELIKFRLSSHFCVKIPASFTKKSNAEFDQFMAATAPSSDSQINITGMFGGLKHYDFNYEGNHYKGDFLGFEPYLFRRQYFYKEENIEVVPSSGDYVIDGGACLGDSSLVFANAVGPTGKTFAFDPVLEHISILKRNSQYAPFKNITIVPAGISNQIQHSPPISIKGYGPGFRIENQTVPLQTIDNLVASKLIPKVDFYKLDVEGAELLALQGAEKTINTFKPKLAISLYHKPNDLFELMLYVKEQHPFYNMYLDHYTIHNEETVLYCIDKESLKR